MPRHPIDIVEHLLELPDTDRESALLAACEGDTALMAEVRALLEIDAEASGFLEPSGPSLAEPWDEPAPEAVGPYRVLERVGEGGFGIVYKAVQETPVRRTVALKVLKAGMDSVSVLRRFEMERQTLALLEHPNVARMLDGGMIPEGQPGAGRPYFAMEFVEGAPITRYAEARGLSVEARVRLLLQACAAAEHAHAKGVIHRDLKPSNILVTEVDGRPLCKVIDFGIAKALGEDLAGATLMTHPGAMIGTPQYMSPEQACGSADADTRSDVYSMGVVLYELLAGVAPFDLRAAKTTDLDRLRRFIAEIEPPTPSSRLTEAGDARRDASEGRRVRGDLDWITMRAIAKDRGRRYGTMAALADDLRRFLESRPVEAGPPSVRYKVRKFVRRNRAAMAAAGVALLLLIGGLVGTSYGLIGARLAEQSARRAEAEARAAEADARRSAEASRAINTFLNEDLLSAVDPGRTADRNITMREVLALASARIDGRFDEQPLIEAELRRTVAQMLERIGDPPAAEAHRRREVQILTDEHGPADRQTTNARQSLATNLLDQGRFAEGIAETRSLLELLRAHRDPGDEQIIRSVNNLGAALLQVGAFDEAEPLMHESLEAKRRTLGEDDPSTLTSVHNLAGLYGTAGDPDRAVEYAQRAYEGRRAALGEGDPRTYSSLHLLSWAMSQAGRAAEAKAVLEANLPAARARLGPAHPRTVTLIDALADAHAVLLEWDAAAALYRESWSLRAERLGEGHLSVVHSRMSYATALSELGRSAEAEEIFAADLDRDDVTRSVVPVLRARWMKSRGDNLRRMGAFDRARVVLDEAWAILGRSPDPSGAAEYNVASAMVSLYRALSAADPDGDHAAEIDRWTSVREAFSR